MMTVMISINFLSFVAENCAICLEDYKDPTTTTCHHTFCKECFHKALTASPYCPVCKVALRPIIGNQPPNGKMTYKVHCQTTTTSIIVWLCM